MSIIFSFLNVYICLVVFVYLTYLFTPSYNTTFYPLFLLSIWAFSTVGFGYDESCGTNVHNDYVHVATDDPTGDKELVYETLEVIAQNALPRLDKFKAQGKIISML